MMEENINNLDFTSYEVNEDINGVRIDKALAKLNPSLSRTHIQTLIDEGYVTCNDKNVKASLKVTRKARCIRTKGNSAVRPLTSLRSA